MKSFLPALTAMLLLASGGASLGSDPPKPDISFSTTPYGFHVTTGFVCQSPDDFQAALTAQATTGVVPDALQCMMLPSDFDAVAVATPVQKTTWEGQDAYITKYEVPGLPAFYGLAHSDHADSDVNT